MSAEHRQLVGARLVAATLGVSVATVYRQAEAGTIPSVRIGRRLRFDPDAVAAAVVREPVAA